MTSINRISARAPRFIAAAALVSISAAAACGTNGDDGLFARPACGMGTVLVDGQCVVSDGGQTPSPSKEADRDDDASSAADGQTNEPGRDASPEPPEGDPCPNRAISVNCSPTCGGPTVSCATHTCAGVQPKTRAPVIVNSYEQLPVVLRTPDRPGVDTACPKTCEHGVAATYGMAIGIRLPYYKTGVRITVPPPWKIASYRSSEPFCGWQGQEFCWFEREIWRELIVYTTDPNAPARNVFIDEAPNGRCE
jgi:hypothetical protein